MSQSAITVDQVTVTYRNGHTALRDATFQVPGGSIAALVGVNGSGKSTLFKALMGFVHLAQGDITILQQSVNKALKKKPHCLCSAIGRSGLVISGAGRRCGDDGPLRPYGLAAPSHSA